MNPELRLQQRAAAASKFNEHLGRGDGERVTGSLADGLGLLADQFLTRVHVDVQRNFGMDSMLIPTSLVKTEEKTKEAWRKSDGEDLADKVGNAGDDIRQELGNAGDRLNPDDDTDDEVEDRPL